MSSPYRLEEHEDAWVLSLGARVTGLQLGMQFILQLYEGPEHVSICIENEFRLIQGCVVREFNPEHPATLGPALVVIHKTIEKATAFKDGRLSIEFEDASRILCYPHPQYEAWQVSVPDRSPPLLLVSEIGGTPPTRDGEK